MKKALLLILVVLFLFSIGCATRDYVRQQIDPLVERISKLEARVSNIDPAEIEGAKRDAADAKALAREAMKTAKDCCERAEAATKMAEDAADRAEAASKKAETAAEKAKKAFELQQKK